MANQCLRAVGVEPLDEMASGRTADDLRELVDHSARTGALDAGRPIGFVHVRDTLTRPQATTARDLMRPVLTLAADTPSYVAVSTMRERRGHIVLVRDDRRQIGLVTLADLVGRLLPDP